MKILYLAAGHGVLDTRHELIYQDLFVERDIGGDMLNVDLSPYDLIIATPPCNYYSRANYRRDISSYSLLTKHLLPCIIKKCIRSGKPFIIENVRNDRIFNLIGLYKLPCFYFTHGRHTYWTNNVFDATGIPQSYDFEYGGKPIQNLSSKERQGGTNVKLVLEHYIDACL